MKIQLIIRYFAHFALASLLLLSGEVTWANVSLPSILSDGMVLQQRQKVKLWGWADPMEKVEIKASWLEQAGAVVTGGNGRWSYYLQTPVAGGPYTIEIKGKNTIILKDVLIGEVWLCSGQSNMDMSFAWGLNYSKEVEQSANSKIRLLSVPKITSAHPQDDIKVKWEVAEPRNVKYFSAIGYFFAAQLQEKLGVPVGIIRSAWGGSPAETWLSTSAIAGEPDLVEASKKLPSNKYASTEVGDNFNTMIYPLRDYVIKGVLWYQGEANVGQTSYGKLMERLIDAWRREWNTELPFFYVQIAPWSGYGKTINAPLLREAQSKLLDIPNTAMVLTSDLVDDISDLHPKQKKEVGLRLAEVALGKTYNISTTYQVPDLKNADFQKNKVIISFTGKVKGLYLRNTVRTGFYAAGADRIFYPAQVILNGDKLVVSCGRVPKPVAIRYNFTGDGIANLFTKEGNPVNQFRTDNWNVSTINQIQ